MENILAFFTPQILVFIFTAVLIIAALMTVALIYHWRFYAKFMGKRIVSIEWWFTAVTVILLISMLFALFGYTASQ
ncbi:MAG TPA: hypothetical protein VJH63_00035 [Candidatus Paceibacterota bacterium]